MTIEDKPFLLTTYIIRREYARTHASDEAQERAVFDRLNRADSIKAQDFPVSDLQLSLDDFSRKQGWMR